MRPTSMLLCLAFAAPSALAAPDASAAKGGDAYADPKGVIAAAHRKQDDDIKTALMSPFTAVDAHYLEAGQSARVGAGESGVSFDPASAGPVMTAISYVDGDFWIAPVTGSNPAAIRKSTEQGTLAPGDGVAVSSKTKLGDGEVVSLGRFLLEMSPQSGMGRILVYDPESPAKKAFTGLKWFAPDLDLQVSASFKLDPSPSKIAVGTSRGLKKEFFRAGTFEFAIGGVPQRLTVLAGSAAPKEGDDLFIPFRDGTTGKESYDVGRYLNMKFRAAGAGYIIDFNDAGNPSCNYSPFYNCPIPPPENTLTLPIRAGEMKYPSQRH